MNLYNVSGFDSHGNNQSRLVFAQTETAAMKVFNDFYHIEYQNDNKLPSMRAIKAEKALTAEDNF